MLKTILTLLSILYSSNAYAQINVNDSTVQITGRWSKNDMESYSIIFQQFEVNGIDTTNESLLIFDVNILVKASTKDGYTIKWVNSNFDTKNMPLLSKKVLTMLTQLPAIFRTDKNGKFIEIINWKQIAAIQKQITKETMKGIKDKSISKEITRRLQNMNTTKDNLESFTMFDIQQFYNFYGQKFKLGVPSKWKSTRFNITGGKPLDVLITDSLEEISEKNGTTIITEKVEFDSTQYTDVSYFYQKIAYQAAGQVPPKREDIPTVQNTIITTSVFDNSTGWLYHSNQSKCSTILNRKLFENRVIMRIK